MKSLHLHIDRIVVEGLSQVGQRRFASALEAQLRTMAESETGEGDLLNQFTRSTRKRIPALSAGQLRPGASPEQAAAQVVRSIRQSIGGGGQGARSNGQRTRVITQQSSGGEARNHA
jgi:hypothetical protein